jgi:hypothetical protein
MPDAKLKPAAEVIAEWYPGKRNSGVLKSHAAKLQADRAAVRADERERCIEVAIGIIERIRHETDGYMVDEGADAGEEAIDALNEAIETIRKGEG